VRAIGIRPTTSSVKQSCSLATPLIARWSWPKMLQLSEMVLMAADKQSSDATTSPPKRVPVAEQVAELQELKAMFSSRSSTDSSQPQPAQPSASVPLGAIQESSRNSLHATGINGLSELLDGLKLSESIATASAWCKEQGVDSVAELKEAEMEGQLVEALNLKPAKAKLLLKRIAEA